MVGAFNSEDKSKNFLTGGSGNSNGGPGSMISQTNSMQKNKDMGKAIAGKGENATNNNTTA